MFGKKLKSILAFQKETLESLFLLVQVYWMGYQTKKVFLKVKIQFFLKTLIFLYFLDWIRLTEHRLKQIMYQWNEIIIVELLSGKLVSKKCLLFGDVRSWCLLAHPLHPIVLMNMLSKIKVYKGKWSLLRGSCLFWFLLFSAQLSRCLLYY